MFIIIFIESYPLSPISMELGKSIIFSSWFICFIAILGSLLASTFILALIIMLVKVSVMQEILALGIIFLASILDSYPNFSLVVIWLDKVMMDVSAVSNVLSLYLCKCFNSPYTFLISLSFSSLNNSGSNCCLLWQKADPETLKNQSSFILLIKCHAWEFILVPLLFNMIPAVFSAVNFFVYWKLFSST